jgi:hypothetical protein
VLSRNVDLQELAQVRLDDAILLFANKRYSSAYYIAGYSVELALKACIAKLFLPDTIPDKAFVNAIYKHDLQELQSVAGLKPQYDADAETDTVFASNWSIACNWTEESRYMLWDSVSTATLLQAISDLNHGVFQWVKRYW